MQKKLVFIPLLILLISFSAGIFTEIAVPAGDLFLSSKLPSVGVSILDYIKNDLVTVAASMLFSCSVFLLPLVPLMVIGKAFSLGFSAAYLLSSSAEKAFGIVLCALLPRGIFKLPAYVALVIISAEAARFVKQNHHNPTALKHGTLLHLRRFLLCFLWLCASSVLEAFLLQGVL